MKDGKGKNGSPLTIIITAIVALVVLSVMPWSDWTNHRLKDFNLLGDLLPESDKTYISHEIIDPELVSVQDSMHIQEIDTTKNANDSAAVTPLEDIMIELPADFQAPKADDGTVLIEDYSRAGNALARFKSALANRASRPVRIAMIGDSYIEGDIFTQDIRSLLQGQYGGSGVGFMAAFSNFPGFRQSVSQSASGWNEHDMRTQGADRVRTLPGIYYSGDAGAKSTFKGTQKPAHTSSWSQSTVMFIAPAAGQVTLDAGQPQTYDVQASTDVQALRVDAETSSFSFTSNIPGLKLLGFWLDSNHGVSLDCMSMRGNSGISHRRLNTEMAAQMRQWIDYDLIIIEFGINALSSEQKEYSAYTTTMVKAVETIRACYPNADILLLGIGDRGQKQGSTVASIATAPAMVKAQRDIARRTGIAFWDMREAMGGPNSAVDWHKRGLVNSDYIHLNHKGGRELADIFVKSLNLSLSE